MRITWILILLSCSAAAAESDVAVFKPVVEKPHSSSLPVEKPKSSQTEPVRYTIVYPEPERCVECEKKKR